MTKVVLKALQMANTIPFVDIHQIVNDRSKSCKSFTGYLRNCQKNDNICTHLYRNLPGQIAWSRLPSPILIERIRPPIFLTSCLLDQIRAAALCIKGVWLIIPYPFSFENIAIILHNIFNRNEDWFSLPVISYTVSIQPKNNALVALQVVQN